VFLFLKKKKTDEDVAHIPQRNATEFETYILLSCFFPCLFLLDQNFQARMQRISQMGVWLRFIGMSVCLPSPSRRPSLSLTGRRVMQCVVVCCSVLQCVVVCCSVLYCVALCCNVLQCVADERVLAGHEPQTTATHCNTHCNTDHRKAQQIGILKIMCVAV